MRTILSLLVLTVLTVLAVGCSSVSQKDDLIPLEMAMKHFKDNGITTVTISDFEYEFGVPQRTGKKIMEVKFNDKYLITESLLFNDGIVAGKISSSYNLNGDTLAVTKFDALDFEKKRTEYVYNSTSKIVEKKYFEDGIMFQNDVIEYDANGLKTEFKHYDKNKLDYNVKYTYDSENREIEWMRYDKEGNPEQKSVSVYNDKGLITDSTYYFSGIVDIKVKYDYDAAGRLTLYTVYTGDGSLFSKIEYKYNFAGQMTEKIIYDSHNVMIKRYEHEYEKEGQYKQVKIFKEGDFLQDIWRFKYNTNFLPKHQEFLNNIEVPKKVRRYSYEPAQN